MITHVVEYKPRGTSRFYVKILHSLELAEKWIEHHKIHYSSWSLLEITGFHPETGEAKYRTITYNQIEEK